MSDRELLLEYYRSRSDDAFAEVVRRQIDHVYAAALRITRDPHMSEDVAQSVFVALAQQPRQAAHCASVSAWLHRITRNVATNIIRSSVRRRKREQEATAMDQQVSSESNPVWEQAAPQLDAALDALSESDRAALTLRYFERKSAGEMASVLGVSVEAAQKRVNRAVDRLRQGLTRKGITIGATSLTAILSTQAIQAAPVGLAASISTGATLFAGAATASTLGAKFLAMTTLQKTVLSVTLATALGTGVTEVTRVSTLRSELDSVQEQRSKITEEAQALAAERDEAKQKASELFEVVSGLQQNEAQLRKAAADASWLRAELVRSQAAAAKRAQAGTAAQAAEDPFTQSILALAFRAAEINQHLEQMPVRSIPELQYLTENDWLDAAREADLTSESGVRKALSKLRGLAKNRFGSDASSALDRYVAANNGRLPASPVELKPFFKNAIDETILNRYEMLKSGNTKDLPEGTTWLVSEKAPVDRDHDSHLYVGLGGRSGTWGTGPGSTGDPDPEWASR